MRKECGYEGRISRFLSIALVTFAIATQLYS